MIVNNSNFTVFLKAAYHEDERNFAGSNLKVFKHILLKFSKTAKSNVSLLRYKS